jgi:hypothetical protein
VSHTQPEGRGARLLADPEAGRPTPRYLSVVRSEWFLVGLLTLAVIAVRVHLAVTDGGPTLYFDEDYYLQNARSIFALAPYAQVHYPPLYSLVVAPGLAFHHWYPAVMAIGGLVSSLTVPASWFLAKSLGLRHPVWAAAIVAVIPAQYAYAQLLMSENLSTPLFVVGLALAVRGRNRESWLLGAVATCLMLTKYLFLPAVFLLVAIYVLRWIQNRRAERGDAAGVLRMLAAVAAPVVVLFGGWLAYGSASGFSLFDMLGLTVPADTVETAAAQGSTRGLLMWIAIYIGMLCLPVVPAWFVALVGLGSARIRRTLRTDRTQLVFLLAVIVFAALYVLVAAQHADGSHYNYPTPTRAWGRYLMHLTAPIIVLGLMFLERLIAVRGRLRPIPVILEAVAVAAAAVGTWSVLFRGSVFHLPRWNFTYPLTAADTFPFRSPLALVGILVVVAVAAAFLAFPGLQTIRLPAVAGAWLVVTMAMTASWVLGSVPYDSYVADNANLNGSLPRKLFQQMDSTRASVGERYVYVLADGLHVGHPSFDEDFWGVAPGIVTLIDLPDLGMTITGADRTASGTAALKAAVDRAACDPTARCVLVTKHPLSGAADLVDPRWGQTIRFYVLH